MRQRSPATVMKMPRNVVPRDGRDARPAAVGLDATFSGRRARPPVLLLGGLENSLSVMRSIGRLGVAVDISAEARSPAPHSRFCRRAFPNDPPAQAGEFWRGLLPSAQPPVSVILGCSDDALEFLAENSGALRLPTATGWRGRGNAGFACGTPPRPGR